MQTPLADFELFSSRDLDEAREKVAAVFCPHRLDTIGKGDFAARHNHLRGSQLSLNYIDYGAKTLIAPGELGEFYLLQIPVSGGATIVNGNDRYYSHSGAASVLNPHLPTTMIWDEGCRQLLVQIDRQALQDHLSAHLGGAADRPVTFTGPMDIARGDGASLVRLVRHLVAEADGGVPTIGRGGLMSRQIESAILTGLLESHSHNYSRYFGSGGGTAIPRHVRVAEDFLIANLDAPLTIEDIAAVAEITPRALQSGFRRFRNTTPLAFLRNARLSKAHAELSAGKPGTTVTDVAMRWGFTHFGRFSHYYRQRFGCSPSDTLRSANGPIFEN